MPPNLLTDFSAYDSSLRLNSVLRLIQPTLDQASCTAMLTIRWPCLSVANTLVASRFHHSKLAWNRTGSTSIPLDLDRSLNRIYRATNNHARTLAVVHAFHVNAMTTFLAMSHNRSNTFAGTPAILDLASFAHETQLYMRLSFSAILDVRNPKRLESSTRVNGHPRNLNQES
jgi:hypothetical protein